LVVKVARFCASKVEVGSARKIVTAPRRWAFPLQAGTLTGEIMEERLTIWRVGDSSGYPKAETATVYLRRERAPAQFAVLF
jgi:hypothetical protein